MAAASNTTTAPLLQDHHTLLLAPPPGLAAIPSPPWSFAPPTTSSTSSRSPCRTLLLNGVKIISKSHGNLLHHHNNTSTTTTSGFNDSPFSYRYIDPTIVSSARVGARAHHVHLRALPVSELELTMISCRTSPPSTPYPWSTNLYAKVHTLDHLLTNFIHNITDDVKCKRFQLHTIITYELCAEFDRMAWYLEERVGTMHSRAPHEWMELVLLDYPGCKKTNCLMSVLVDVKKKAIN